VVFQVDGLFISYMDNQNRFFLRGAGYLTLGLVLAFSVSSVTAQRRNTTDPITTLLDSNRNRELGAEEIVSAPERLKEADLNHDGNVTGEEISERLEFLKNNRPGIIQTDFPYQMAAIGAPSPKGNVAKKGMAISVGNGASVLFDTDLVRMAAGWTGALITTTGVSFDGSHGGFPKISGTQLFGTPAVAGWADTSGQFLDDRPEPFGPINADQGRWDGHYMVGDQVTLAYSVHGTKIYEQPSSLAVGETIGFVRSLKVSGFDSSASQSISMMVADVDGFSGQSVRGRASLMEPSGTRTYVSLLKPVHGVSLSIQKRHITMNVAPSADERLIQLVIWRSDENADLEEAAFKSKSVPFVPFEKGGPERWPEPVVTQGKLEADATPDGAYVVDRLTPPIENPWNRRLRLGGFDFFADGKSAAFSTWDGDVWLLEGIDDDLKQLKWKRFASGLFETLGLRIVDEVIYVSSRVGILRLHDLNQDGTCDFYENFNNELTSSVGFHEFVFDLHTDSDGNFYYAKAGPVRGGGRGFGSKPEENNRFGNVSPHAGTVVRVDREGKKLDVYATGFRAPNGIGVGPDGQVTTGDNEGTWIPACPINWVEEGGFYGVEDLAHRDAIPEFNPPLCWLAKKDFDNSGGSQVWVTSDRWGPFEGELLHLSYGQCAMYLVMKERVEGQMQGGVVKIPVSFGSSAMRARFNQLDGQLYVAGLRGWQTKAAQLSGFDRVRYTGKKVYTVRDLKVQKEGVQLTFSQPVDKASAGDVENYAVQQWNYRRSSDYGSRDYSVEIDGERGRDPVDIEKAIVSDDGKTVTLIVDGLKPVMQFEIDFSIEAADGTEIRQKTLQTIHNIPGV
jgi:glucose/arabinose dehydrogenase